HAETWPDPPQPGRDVRALRHRVARRYGEGIAIERRPLRSYLPPSVLVHAYSMDALQTDSKQARPNV
ncbi:MAG: hypothetical protein ACO3PR_17345, partial [Limisphaerales bacterium]